MPTIVELHQMYLRQLDATLAESELLLQREGGLDGELKTSGAICEHFVRNTLRQFIVPGHFRITSGFIATPKLLQSHHNLPQCDILLVEGGIPPILRFEHSDIEVVPWESVVGIIEVKRTLTPETLFQRSSDRARGALAQIDLITRTLDVGSALKADKILNRFNRHVGFHNHSSDKPLIGVISLRHDSLSFQYDVPLIIEKADSLVDFVWSLDGGAVIPGFFDGTTALKYYTHTARPETQTWEQLKIDDFKSCGSEFYRVFDGKPVWAPLCQTLGCDRAVVFSRVAGIISLMLSRVSTRPLRENEINEYYLHD